MKRRFTPEEIDRLPTSGVYRLRGLSTTRIETFTDAAFAFALSMLVLSLGALPGSMEELEAALKGVPAFAASFSMIGMFWYFHHEWSRRFGLEDGPTILLSFLLVFTVLIYVYPLRVMFSGMFFWFSGGYLTSQFSIAGIDDLGRIFVIYGAGFVVMCAVFILLNLHALRVGERLALSERERYETRTAAITWGLVMATGVASVAVALLLEGPDVVAAGFVYCVLPVVTAGFSRLRAGRARERFEGA